MMFVWVLQLALALHVRNVLADCATQGARQGALVGSDPAAGSARTRELIRAELSDRYAEHVHAGLGDLDGLPVVEVRVEAPLPVLGTLGPGRRLTVTGHAVLERDAASADRSAERW